jgi:alpha-glucan,water dikinase
VMGDEEIPDGVTAVIAPDVTDIVSHVAVRARNANLLFATCYDRHLFNRLKGLAGQRLDLSVNAAGDVVFEPAAKEIRPAPAHLHRARLAPTRPRFTAYAVLARDFQEGVVGAKSHNQARLRGKLPDWINLPPSVAVPFGVFEHVLSLPENRSVAGRCGALARELADDTPNKLSELREAIAGLIAPDEFAPALHQAVEEAGLPWPDDWNAAWTCIKRVWASKWNERAFHSRTAAGIAHDDLFMAVLIQQVVDAEYAFVIHTLNPLSGSKNEIYAEVVPGLGETVVANHPGRALSFAYDRNSGSSTLLSYPGKSIGLYGSGLIFRSDSNGEDLAGYAGAGLYDSVLLPPPREVLLDYSQERLAWDEAFRRELLSDIARIGMEVERACASPQDIEGAVAQRKYYLVQTRPQVGFENG